jgi:anti-sigma B factor antagonist
MKVRVLTNQLIHIIEIEGEIHLADANQLKELVMKMIETKTERFIINAEKITAIDSSGMGAFIFISSTLKKLNLALAIANVSKPVQQVIDTIRLADYFPIYRDLQEAIVELSRIK